MKKMLFTGSIAALCLFTSCANNQQDQGTHTHEDGSTHAGHDTTKPNQQEFTPADSAHTDTPGKSHTHKEGATHAH